MENERLEPREPETPKESYVPRPKWQVWGARLLLVVFILGVILYYLSLMRRYG